MDGDAERPKASAKGNSEEVIMAAKDVFTKGKGWGGPAKGAGRGGPAKPFEKGNRASVGNRSNHPGARDRKETAERAKDMLAWLFENAELESTRVSAAVAFLNRVEGMPTAKQELTGKNGSPLLTGITVTFVESENGQG